MADNSRFTIHDSRFTTLSYAFLETQSPSEPALRNQGARIRKTDANPGGGDPASHGREGRPRLRHDRQRQDRRVPAADSSEADREAARQDARTDSHTDPRAR